MGSRNTSLILEVFIEISKKANTLMREKIKIENEGRKFDERDRRLLESIQSILFEELALASNTTVEEVYKRVIENIN